MILNLFWDQFLMPIPHGRQHLIYIVYPNKIFAARKNKLTDCLSNIEPF